MCFRFLGHGQIMTRVLGRTSRHINKTTHELIVTGCGYTTTTVTTTTTSSSSSCCYSSSSITTTTTTLPPGRGTSAGERTCYTMHSYTSQQMEATGQIHNQALLRPGKSSNIHCRVDWGSTDGENAVKMWKSVPTENQTPIPPSTNPWESNVFTELLRFHIWPIRMQN
jgi:hypothetical protein